MKNNMGKFLNAFLSRSFNKIYKISKRIYQLFILKRADRKKVVFIVGCQRSGTSLMSSVFKRDLNTKVYSEFSVLSNLDEHKIRLNPIPLVKREIEREKAALIVLKPLVESQNVVSLLDAFDDSRAIWIYRHYKDVAHSNLAKFGLENGFNNLKPILADERDNWRSENVPCHVKATLEKQLRNDISPFDAAALFWYVRNSFFFELNLESNDQVILCQYDYLVSHPIAMTRKIYEFIGRGYPGEWMTKIIHEKSIGKGKNIELSPHVEELCDELFINLNQRFYQSMETNTPVKGKEWQI